MREEVADQEMMGGRGGRGNGRDNDMKRELTIPIPSNA